MGGSLLIQSKFWKLLMDFFGGFFSIVHLGNVGNQMHAKIIGTNELTLAQVQINEIVHFATSRGINGTTTNLVCIDSEL